MSEGGGDKKSIEYKNQVSPNGEKRSDSKIHTDKEIAKFAGVGTGKISAIIIQRIAVAEKYRPIYERQARKNQGTRNDLKGNFPQNLGESEKKKAAKDREVNSKLAKVANVNPETYRQAKRVLDSENNDLKQRVLSGETSISAGYKELII